MLELNHKGRYPMKQTMKTLSKHHLGPGMSWVDKPIPQIKANEVLVKVLSASICGTDVHIYTWDAWAQNRIQQPHTMGHELSGRIVELGKDVNGFNVGDIVTTETHIVCHTCEFCLSHQAHICAHTKVIGVDIDGVFAEYVALPATNLIQCDPTMDHDLLSVQEPLGNAVHTVMAGDIKNKTVAVLGVGPIGILAVDVAKAMGASKVIAVDVNAYRLDLALKIGADAAIHSFNENADDRIKALVGPYGVDVVLEMSGNGQALKQALGYLKPGGRMSILGIPTQEVSLDIGQDIVFKGITIQGITGRRMYETWDQIKILLNEQRLHLDQIVTHRFDWADYEEAFKLMESGNCGKVVLKIGK